MKICPSSNYYRKTNFNIYPVMKRQFIIAGIVLTGFALTALLGIYIWIDISVQNKITTAKERYGGKAEDALISFLQDESNSCYDRSHVAIWTLGQIHSQKAIPLLEQLYTDDPRGETCKGKHDSLLCQYEIHKALQAARSNWWPLHGRLNR
jgi:hypothetical protein